MTIDCPASAQLPQLQKLWKEAFGDTDEDIRIFFDTAFSLKRCRCITVEEQVAAALYWLDCTCGGEKMAYLYAVATGKAFRGRGLCRQLMENVHDHLKEKDYAGTILVPASQPLETMYAGMGYLPGTTVCKFSCPAGDTPVALSPIDASEYALFRRRLLPSGGVVQEGENLAYLQKLCRLYRGEDFLLAARVEGDTVYTEEFLGNADAAPGIVKALGAAAGQFRTPGQEKSFAMYHPLRADCPAPGYFGLAFA